MRIRTVVAVLALASQSMAAGAASHKPPLIPLTQPPEALDATGDIWAANLDAGLLVAGYTRWDHDGDGVIFNETYGAWLWRPTGGMRIFRISDELYWRPSFYIPTGIADNATVAGTTIIRQTAATAAWQWTAASGLEFLPLPDGNWTGTAAAISQDGQVITGTACRYNFFPGQCLESRAILWTDGMLAELPSAATFARAHGLDASGTVVVGATGPGSTTLHATRWVDGVEQPVDPVGTSSTAQFSSADGSVAVGTAVLADDDATVALVRWGPGGDAEIFGPPKGTSLVELHAISVDGNVAVGSLADGPGDPQFRDWAPFVWSASAGFRILPEAKAGETFRRFNRSRAVDVTDDGGTVVGVLQKSPRGPGDPPTQAVVWTDDTELVSVNELIADLGIEEPDFYEVAAISGNGEWVLTIGSGVPDTAAVLLRLDK